MEFPVDSATGRERASVRKCSEYRSNSPTFQPSEMRVIAGLCQMGRFDVHNFAGGLQNQRVVENANFAVARQMADFVSA